MIKKQNKLKVVHPSKLYKWVDSNIFNNRGIIFAAVILSLWFALIFWFPMTEQPYGESTNMWNNHGINNWILGLLFFLIWELLYVWICMNDAKMKRDDVGVVKFFSCFQTYIIFALVVPFIYFCINAFQKMNWSNVIVVLKWLGLILGMAISVVIVCILFYKLNVWIFKMIRGAN